MAKTPSTLGPVFVVGMNGSGTTMLSDCLNRHPQFYMFPQETLVLPYYISKLDTYGDLSQLPARRKLAADLGKHWAYWQTNGKERVILTDDMLDQPGFSGVLNGLYGYFAALEGKARWGDKTPMYVQNMLSLKSTIPNAKFIHIYRDGRDAAQSFHRRWGHVPRHTIYRWKKIVHVGREQGMQLGPESYLEISYEALTLEPEKHLKKICNFLILSFHPDVLKSKMPYMSGLGYSREFGSIMKNSEKWRSYFSSKQKIQLEQIAGNSLAELGYTVTLSNNDKEPSALHLGWWRLFERLQSTKNSFQRHGIKAVGSFLRRAREAIIQSRTNRY